MSLQRESFSDGRNIDALFTNELQSMAISAGFSPRTAEEKLLRFLLGASEIKESAYGWVGLSSIVCFPALKEVAESTTGDFLAVDLCSSLPVWAAHLRKALPSAFGRDGRVISVDNEDTLELQRRAYLSFTDEFKSTDIFWEAIDAVEMGDHFQKDIFDLELPRNSVDFVTSIEGYPFYFDDGEIADRETHMQFTLMLADSLKPGGKMVFFPWYFQNDDRQKHRRLTFLENLFEAEGLVVKKTRHNWGHLMGNLSEDEEMLTFQSPLFKKYRRAFVSLELTKPLNPGVLVSPSRSI